MSTLSTPINYFSLVSMAINSWSDVTGELTALLWVSFSCFLLRRSPSVSSSISMAGPAGLQTAYPGDTKPLRVNSSARPKETAADVLGLLPVMLINTALVFP